MSFFGSTDLSKKFYVQDFHNAYRFRPHVNPVRQKFQGYVNFVLNREFWGTLYGDADQNEFRTTISSLVKTADLPSVNFQTEVKNSFNRKRIKLTGREYNPVTMQVYDTVGNEWISVLMKYFSYHFMDPRNQEQGADAARRDIGGSNAGKSFGGTDYTGSTFGKTADSSSMAKFTGAFDSNADGLNIQKTSNFFERIDYVLYHGKKGIQYSLINPFLVRFTPTPLDYADSSAFEFGLEFQYEKFTVHSIANFDLGAEDMDRFDPTADKFSGPAHELDPLVEDNLASGPMSRQDLEFLTPKDSDFLLTRSTQEHAIASPEPNDDETEGNENEETDGQSDPDGEEVSSGDTDSTDGLRAVYGQAATFAGPGTTPSTGFSWIDDLFDAGIAAAISGADVKDAIIGSVGQSAIKFISEQDVADNPADQQEPPDREGGE